FDDNALLPLLFGQHDANLDRIERELGVTLVTRGNRLAITGPAARSAEARAALATLYERLKRGLEVDGAAVESALRQAQQQGAQPFENEIHTRKRRVVARSPNQAAYIRALRQ